MRWSILLLLTVPHLLCAQVGAEFFEKKVRPVLVAQCYACHSAKAKIVQGGLRLDSREAFIRGGQSGPAVVVGDPGASLLVKVLRRQVKPAMPPWGKLPEADVAAIEEWIREGAVWPAEQASAAAHAKGKTDPEAARRHWAWQPVRKPANAAIDQLIGQKLAEKKLSANGMADAATLLRRLSVDLTGLPPSPELIREFLKDPTPERYKQVADSMLGSVAYAERWGRFWLDVTYYADTMDPNAGIPAAHAWRYRDYVVKAFQEDRPLNRFITEQIAGDLLPEESPARRNELIVATGYLALGPWTLVQADKEQLKMDVVDAQIDGIGKGLLGLTLGCARCHDHKFDPVSQREYYGLAGILASTRTVHGKWREAGVFSDINQRPLWESPEETALRLERAATQERALADVLRRIEGLEAARKQEKDKDRLKEIEGKLTALRRRQGLLDFNMPRPPVGYAVQEEERAADCQINIRGNAHQLGQAVPRTFVQAAMFGQTTPELKGSGRLELARWITDDRNPLTARVYVNRVWQNLFGTGLVKSADNFGLRGESPSHPELLDYLAVTFMEDGWSTKKLIRRIVATEAYRRASTVQKAAMEVDPENRLLWRMNRRRLEAEAIRDSVLAITGQLDRTVGGPTLPTDSLATFAPDLGKVNPPRMIVNGALPERLRNRRTVHLPVFRPALMDDLDLMNLFDFANSAQVNATRRETVVPTQALYLLNAKWLRDQSRVLARRLLDSPELADPGRVERAIALIYNRPVQTSEVSRALDFIYDAEQQSNVEDAWTLYLHSLLASNEFLFRS
ncbi:MAG: PSD1 domain-containing protein [Bryobacterales bacterium]|nr:PSD1 domain-containing protein [Bryobacterales bacterium]